MKKFVMKPIIDQVVAEVQNPLSQSTSSEIMSLPSDVLATLQALTEKLDEFEVKKLPVDPKVATLVDKFRKVANFTPDKIARAIEHGRFEDLTGIANVLGYTGSGRTDYAKIHLAKILTLVRDKLPGADNLLAKLRRHETHGFFDVDFSISIVVLRDLFVRLTRKVNNIKTRKEILDSAVNTSALKQYRRQLPTLPALKVKEVNQEKTAQLDFTVRPKPKASFHPRTMATISPAMTSVIFGMEFPKELSGFFLRLRTDMSDIVSRHYFGTGTELGQIRRLLTVYKAYRQSQAAKAELPIRPGQSPLLGHDDDGEYFYTKKTMFAYLKLTGVKFSPRIFSTLPESPADWNEYFRENGYKTNPLNLQSDAGAPYLGYKKGQAIGDGMHRSVQLYEACQKYPRRVIKTMYPEVGVIDLKAKSETYELREPFDLKNASDSLKWGEWLKANEHQLKVRTIYNPPLHTWIFQLLMNAVFKNTNSWKSLDELQHKLKNDDLFFLKSFPFVSGTFDMLMRRIAGHAPFKGDGFLKMCYSDNGYILTVSDGNWVVPTSTVTVVPTHPGLDDLLQDLSANADSEYRIPAGTRILVSIDGAKMESATDEQDCKNFLRWLGEYLNFDPRVMNYIAKAAAFSISGGVGILGNRAFRIRYQGSGNSVTFNLNDLKLFGILNVVTPDMNFDDIQRLAARQGVTLTLERVTILGPPDTPIAAPGDETQIDMLGFGCGYIKANNGLYIPVLERARRLKALFANKRGDRASRRGELSKMYALYVYGGHVDPAMTWCLKTRAGQLAREVGELATSDFDDMMPLPDRIIQEINDKGADAMDALLVANLFSADFVDAGNAIVHTVDSETFIKEWGYEPELNPESGESLLLPKNHGRLKDIIYDILTRSNLPIPTLRLSFDEENQVENVQLNPDASSTYKLLLSGTGIGRDKLPLIKAFLKDIATLRPEMASSYKADWQSHLDAEADEVRRQKDRDLEIKRLREERKAEKARRKVKQVTKLPPIPKQGPRTLPMRGVSALSKHDGLEKLPAKQQKQMILSALSRQPPYVGPIRATDFGGRLYDLVLRSSAKAVFKDPKVKAAIMALDKPVEPDYRQLAKMEFDLASKVPRSSSLGNNEAFVRNLLYEITKAGALATKLADEIYSQSSRVATFRTLLKSLEDE